MRLRVVDVPLHVMTCVQGIGSGLEPGVVVAGPASPASVQAAAAAAAAGQPDWLLAPWCHREVSRQCWAVGLHSCSQASSQMFAQALRYGTGIVSAEGLEGDAVLLVRRREMVWVALVRLLVGLRVVVRAVFQAGAGVVLELQA